MTNPTGEAPAVPRCYRHPDRETYVSCTRCERPICPDCMRDASVGFQCPDCVAEGLKGVRKARAPYGGSLAGYGGIVTKVLIAINAVVYLLQQGQGSLIDAKFAGFRAVSYIDNGSVHIGGLVQGEYYRLVTAAFLHVSILHIGFNMYLLYVLGLSLEAVLGRWRFIAVYFVSAIGGNVLAYVMDQGGEGASGAVFGLFAATYLISRQRRLDTSQITFLIVANLVLGFVVKNIGYWAHIGGLLTGALLTAIIIYAPRAQRVAVQAAGIAIVTAALMGVALLETAHLKHQPPAASGSVRSAGLAAQPVEGRHHL